MIHKGLRISGDVRVIVGWRGMNIAFRGAQPNHPKISLLSLFLFFLSSPPPLFSSQLEQYQMATLHPNSHSNITKGNLHLSSILQLIEQYSLL